MRAPPYARLSRAALLLLMGATLPAPMAGAEPDRTDAPHTEATPAPTVPMPNRAKPGAVVVVGPTAPAPTGRKRIALVLANGQYKAPAEPLPQAHADAWRMADALAASGFEVLVLEDANALQTKQGLDELVRRGGEGAVEAALVYYAGHGARVPVRDGVVGVLVPLEAEGRDEASLVTTSVSLTELQQRLVDTGAKNLIAVIDACRDNPYLAGWLAGGRGGGDGGQLRGSVSAPPAQARGVGLTWAFATQPGWVARDGVYTPALAARLRTGCGELNSVFDDVSAEVRRATGDKQAPERTVTSSGQRFMFRDDGSCAPGPEEWRRLEAAMKAKEAEAAALQLQLAEARRAADQPDVQKRQLAEAPRGGGAPVASPVQGPASVPSQSAAEGAAETAEPKRLPAETQLIGGGGLAGSPVQGNTDYPMVEVRPGSFMMGSPSSNRWDSYNSQHEVRLTRSFLIGTIEVPQRQWSAVMPANRWFYQGADLPAHRVNWCEAVAFANALSARDGLPVAYQGVDQCESSGSKSVVWDRTSTGYRLPTEAEWEYAARGGDLGSGNKYIYAGSNDVVAVGWISSNAEERPHTVGGLKPNVLGVHDMTGNVGEWCWDWHGAYSASSTDPVGAQSGRYRVIRGGAYLDFPPNARVDYRSSGPPGASYYESGLRLVRTLP
jgi:sulfatase modifying factor 1